MNKRFRLVSALAYAAAILTGVFTLASQAAATDGPVAPAPSPYWHCEYCRCAFPQGVCECTNCTFY